MAEKKVNVLYPLQICCLCGETKPTTRENFGTKPNGKPRAQCRVCRRKLTNEYAAANRDKGRARARNRKTRLESVGYVNEYLQYREPLLKLQRELCYFCQTAITSDTIEIDHLTPISRGGDNHRKNLVGCCASCNKAKTNKTEGEFIIWRAERLKNYR